MGQAKITANLKEGLYSIDYTINHEAIDFEQARLEQLVQDLLDQEADLQGDVTDAETARDDANHTLQEAIKKLNGAPSEDLTAALAAARAALASAKSAISTTAGKSAEVATDLDDSRNALPLGVPQSILDAYNQASSDLASVQFKLTDERSAVSDVDDLAGDAQSAIGSGDMETARAKVQAALDAMAGAVATKHTDTESAISQASSSLNAVSLPSDPAYATAQARLDDAKAAMPMVGTDHTTAADQENAATDFLKKAQLLMTPGRPEAIKAVQEATKALVEAGVALKESQLALDTLEAQLSDADARIIDLRREQRTVTLDAWCTDLTEDYTADQPVGTMEVPGEPPASFSANKPWELILRPGFFTDERSVDDKRDGLAFPARALTPAGWANNIMRLPGWQVLKPQYRIGIITSINPDQTVDVNLLEPDHSSQQNIFVEPRTMPDNQRAPLSHIPVRYMECNIDAFALGDQVVIEYQERTADKPQVIGFRDHPKPCCAGFFTPTGSIGGGPSTWKFKADTTLRYDAQPPTGNIQQWGVSCPVSFQGPVNRYWQDSAQGAFGTEIYHRGKLIATAPEDYFVVGAALQKTAGSFLLVAILATVDHSDEAEFYRYAESVWTKTYPSEEPLAKLADISVPDELHIHNFGFFDQAWSPWFFNQDGTEARRVWLGANVPIAGDLFFTGEAKSYVRSVIISDSGIAESTADEATVTASVDSSQVGISVYDSGGGIFVTILSTLNTYSGSGESIYATDYHPTEGWRTARLTGSYQIDDSFTEQFFAGDHEESSGTINDDYVHQQATINLEIGDRSLAVRQSDIFLSENDDSSVAYEGAQVFAADLRVGSPDGKGAFGYDTHSKTGSGASTYNDLHFTPPLAYTSSDTWHLDNTTLSKNETGSGSFEFDSFRENDYLLLPFVHIKSVTGSWVYDKRGNLCASQVFNTDPDSEAFHWLTGGDLVALVGGDGAVIFSLGLG